MINYKTNENKKKIIWIIIINILSLVINVLLFEPTLKQDDQEMTYLLYGAYDGYYSQHILYINYFFAGILKQCLKVAPNIPWYTVSFYFLIMISFIIIGVLSLKFERNNIIKLFYFVLVILLGHEYYIRITFTKVSGLLITTGILLVLSFIQDNTRLGILKLFLGIIFCVVGNLIRTRVYLLCIFILLFYFLFCLIKSIKTNNIKSVILRIFFAGIVFIIIFFINTFLEKENYKCYINSDLWKNYYTDNWARVAIQDYGGAPDYNKYKEEYKKLGISYNDYYVWWELGWRIDTEKLTNDVSEKVREIAPIYDGKGVILRVKDAIKMYGTYNKNNACLYSFIFVGCLFIFLGDKNKSLMLLLTIFCGGITSYIILYVKGRVTHHVNVVIWMFCIALYVFVNRDVSFVELFKSKLLKYLLPIILLAYIVSDYNNIISQAYLGEANGIITSEKENVKKNKETLQLLSLDVEHCYIFSPKEWFGGYLSETALDVVQKGMYHNLFNGFSSVYQVGRNIYEKYGIRNPMRELCDSDILYIACTDSSEYQIQYIEKYLRENYSEVSAYKVKIVGDLCVYKFMTEYYEPQIIDYYNDESIVDEIEYTVDKDVISYEGNIYISGISSYTTNIYLVIKNGNDSKYIPLTQSENIDSQEDLNGKYSHISGTINKDYFNEDMQIYFLLENSGIGYIKDIGNIQL